MRVIIKFFDKLEDKVRAWFSHYPIFYAIVGGVGTVLFWRGVWHTADFFSARYFHPIMAESGALNVLDASVDFPFFWDGFVSLILGTVILLMTGLFVASFIGDHIIISGVRHEKKVTEKTEEEVEEEESVLKKVHEELHGIGKRLEEIEKKIATSDK
ncbi:MAG: hypothetical protein HYY10_04350 [Candidatus Liptonbacteria bacterium]|nr:hypothetical protein [Candidatus Liptonbacteria bacterium]